jgi:hypothetical protein
MALVSGGVYRHEEEGIREWWFTGRDAVIFIQEFKKMRNIKEAEVFTQLKEMGGINASKWVDKAVGNKKVWIMDVREINEDAVSLDDFRLETEDKEWE